MSDPQVDGSDFDWDNVTAVRPGDDNSSPSPTAADGFDWDHVTAVGPSASPWQSGTMDDQVWHLTQRANARISAGDDQATVEADLEKQVRALQPRVEKPSYVDETGFDWEHVTVVPPQKANFSDVHSDMNVKQGEPSLYDMNKTAMKITALGAAQKSLDDQVAADTPAKYAALLQSAYGGDTLTMPDIPSDEDFAKNHAEAVAARDANLQKLQDALAEQQKQQQALKATNTGGLDSVKYYAKQGLGNAAPIVVGAGIGTAFPGAAPFVLPGLFGSQAYAQKYGEARGAGVDEGTAGNLAAVSGIVNAGTAAIPGGAFASKVASPLAKGALVAGANELAGTVSTPAEMLADKYLLGQEQGDIGAATAEAAKTNILPSLVFGVAGARSHDTPGELAARRINDLTDQLTPESHTVAEGAAWAEQLGASARPETEPPSAFDVPEKTPPEANENVQASDRDETPRQGAKLADAPQNASEEATGPVRYSREEPSQLVSEPGSDADLVSTWKALAQHEDAFRYKNSDAKTLPGILRDSLPNYIAAHSSELAEGNVEPADRAWEITTPSGNAARVFQKGDDVWLDVSDLEQGQQGSAIYAAVGNYAKNNDLHLIPDPAGLSNIALKRRSDAMLSSALKQGTTSHLEPDLRQERGNTSLGIEPLRWSEGDDDSNIASLIRTTHATTLKEFPEIAQIAYNPEAGRFERPDGSEVTNADFNQIAVDGRRRAEAAIAAAYGRPVESLGAAALRPVREAFTAGSGTLKRAAFTNAILRGQGQAIRGRLLARAGGGSTEPATGQSLQDLNLARTLYGRDEANLPTSNEDNHPVDTDIEPARGMSAEEARAALQNTFGGVALNKMERRGLTLVPKDQIGALTADLSDAQRAGVRGFAQDGKPYIVHDNVTPEQLPSVVVHEIWHANADKVLSSDKQSSLARAVEQRARLSPEIAQSLRRIPESTPAEHRDAEVLAQTLGDLYQQPVGKQVMDAIKLGLNRLGVPLDWMNAHEAALRDIGIQNLRHYTTSESPRNFSAGSGSQNTGTPTPGIPPFSNSDRELPTPGAHTRPAVEIAPFAAKSIRVVANRQRDLARGIDREAWAQRDRAVGSADAAVDQYRKYFDARPASVRNNPLRSYASVIDYQNGRQIADSRERAFISTAANLLQKQAEEIRSFGNDKLPLLDQYFPQLWKEPGRAESMYQQMRKGSLEGSKGFTKERLFDDYEQGIKAGMVPAFDNPADQLMARYQAGEKYLAALRIKKGLEDLGLVHEVGKGERIPTGYATVDDRAFAGKAVPELVAKDLNNYLAPGLMQYAPWRGFRYLENLMLTARLGFSAFHAGFTTVDAAITHLDLAGNYLARGQFAEGIRQLGQIPVTPVRAIAGMFGKSSGSKLLRQFYGQEAADTHTAAILDALTQGGTRGRMHPTDWNNDFNTLTRSLRRGEYGVSAAHVLQGVAEGLMRPIAHYLVPAQKMTARVEMMKFELDRLASSLGTNRGDYASTLAAMHPDALRQIAHDVVQRVDDRIGQMAYDNLFWNRIAKDIAQATIQSVGWNVGTANVVFGGIRDAAKLFHPKQLLAPLDKAGKITNAQMSRVTGRLSYLLALNLGVGALGATAQYLLTGQSPKELKDYFFPKTGRKNLDGSDERVSFPSYVKDEFALAAHPIQTAEHKLHPMFSTAAELLNNKDFYGNEVYNPDAPWTKVAQQIATHVAQGFMPYAVQNQTRVAESGGGVGARLAPFFGVTPAPSDITHTDFQNYVQQHYYSAHPNGGKTPEQAEQTKAFLEAANAIKRGEHPDLSNLTSKERTAVKKYAASDPFETHFAKLGIAEKLRAYDLATDAERQKYRLRQHILSGNVEAALEREPEDQRTQLLRQVKLLIRRN